jgi:hypothetical protein
MNREPQSNWLRIFGTDVRGDGVHRLFFTQVTSIIPFRLGCGKVETDTISKTMTFQPLKQERFTCIQLIKTETGTTKSSLYCISSDVRAESLTNDFEVNDLFTSPGITIFTTKFSGFQDFCPRFHRSPSMYFGSW